MFDNLLRGLTTNHANWDPGSPDPAQRPLELAIDVDQAAARLRTWVEDQANWSIEDQQTVDAGLHLSLTRRTPVFRFTDDIRVRLRSTAEGEGCVVEAESRSRIGKGDLGQNRRNLGELRSVFR